MPGREVIESAQGRDGRPFEGWPSYYQFLESPRGLWLVGRAAALPSPDGFDRKLRSQPARELALVLARQPGLPLDDGLSHAERSVRFDT